MPDEARSDNPTFCGRFSKMVRGTPRSDVDLDREAWQRRGHLQRSQGCPARRKKGIECRQQAGAGIQNGSRRPSTTRTPGVGPSKNAKRQTSRDTADDHSGEANLRTGRLDWLIPCVEWRLGPGLNLHRRIGYQARRLVISG
jgi:hypothetical protein